MAGPLRELAAQYDAELKALELNLLTPIAEALSHPDADKVKPELFAVLAAVRGALTQLDEDAKLRESMGSRLEAFEAAEAERLRKREAGQKVLADRRKARMAALDQLVRSLVELRNVDAPPEADSDRAAFDQHIAALQGRYGRDASIRD
jgi:aminoglycoside phosphotransferase (APT) family kinase protein